MTTGRRVLLLVPARSYRAADFVLAATRMGLDLTVASDGALPVGDRPVIPVRHGDPDLGAERIASRAGPVDAVVAADAPMLPLAAAVGGDRRVDLGVHHPPGGLRQIGGGAGRSLGRAGAGGDQPDAGDPRHGSADRGLDAGGQRERRAR